MAFTITGHPDPYRRDDGTLRHNVHRSHHPTGTDAFLCVDGEGVTLPSGEHRYVLLGCGEAQIDDANGLYWRDILKFLDSQAQTRTALTGFYLGYDFTQWLKTLPAERAWRLLTIDGKESRRSKSPKLKGKFLPVDVEDWQIDILGSKRLAFRYKPCDCPTVKCDCEKGTWRYVCDTGPFFQTSFMNVIAPRNWLTPIVTDDEYATILAGKAARETAKLDDDMRRYNRLENTVLSRVLHDLDAGFRKLDVTLSASQWYGPGQASQSWMKGRAPTRKQVDEAVPDDFMDAARRSYFGGWFEIQAHGIIPDECHEYDINSAYPHIIASLPCLLHGAYTHGTGRPTPGPGEITLARALVWQSKPRTDYRHGRGIAGMLHRNNQGGICRPIVTAGWYWWHELVAAERAKFITRTPASRVYEWITYTPCECPPPLRHIASLYQMRLDVGKKASLSKAAKLVANSAYGKTAQSVGVPLFGNPVYASLITAGCRTMISDAIATHPEGKADVVMVATDAIFFRHAHPLLPVSERLGNWEHQARTNLTLFKPGVYWDDTARGRIADGQAPQFKARGVSAKAFGQVIQQIDDTFRAWVPGTTPTFPKITFKSGFAMTTALQAITRHEWDTAGTVHTEMPLVQSANPADKRKDVWFDAVRGYWRSEPHEAGLNAVYRTSHNFTEWGTMDGERFDSVPYEKRFGHEDPWSDESKQIYGVTPDEESPMMGAFHILAGRE